ncbi:MAG: hypothetical protein FWF05_09510 [Oscillospiraceae bacterium]|nr:hypothetical protein [Oscillospiraceae bacterium]
MNQWTVLNSLRQFTALDDEGAAKALPFCKTSLDEIRENLRDAADENDPRVIRAAAGLAFYRMTVQRLAGEDSVTSFKAGDVTVSQSASAALDIASKIRDETYLAVLPLLKDDRFIFMQT